MTRKDFEKGMKAGAGPFKEKFQEQSRNLQDMAQNINKKMDNINSITDNIIHDLNSTEKKRLYDLNTIVDIAELGNDEKELLIAILFKLANMKDNVTEYQKSFLRSVKNYLKINNVQTSIDLSVIENVENINDQKAILQTVMEFLFLKNADHEYMDKYEYVIDYFSVNKRGIQEIQKCIDEIYNATGLQGIAENYGYVVIEETKKDEMEDTNDDDLYDGRDICEACADIINVHKDYAILDDYLVYLDLQKGRGYRVSKKDGSNVEIISKLDITLNSNVKVIGCGNYLFILNVIEYCILKININTLQSKIIKLIGKDTDKYQCNKDYFIYIGKFEDTKRLVKINLKNDNIEILKHIVNSKNILICEEYYLVDKNIYFKVQYSDQILEEDSLNSNTLYKFNLDKETLKRICLIPDESDHFTIQQALSIIDGFQYYNILSSNHYNHYKNILFSSKYRDFVGLSYVYLDIDNAKAIRNTNITNNKVYPFIAYNYIFYVTLDSNMSIGKYNIVTGENTIILKTSKCADTCTHNYSSMIGLLGLFIKKNHYLILNRAPQVIGRWLYYVGRISNNVRKVSIDAENGKSQELILDGKPVHRLS